jgi:hypothetical protein
MSNKHCAISEITSHFGLVASVLVNAYLFFWGGEKYYAGDVTNAEYMFFTENSVESLRDVSLLAVRAIIDGGESMFRRASSSEACFSKHTSLIYGRQGLC